MVEPCRGSAASRTYFARARVGEFASPRILSLQKPNRPKACVQRPENRSLLLPLFNLATAVDDERHLLAVFHRPDGDTFGGALDVSDLRVACGFKLGYKLLLRQGVGRRQDANDRQTKDCLRDCSRQHDLCSPAK
jgi:hypothetical protein